MRHPPVSPPSAELAALDREIAFAEAQWVIYSRGLGPHHVRDQQEVLRRLHDHLDALEARRRVLCESERESA